jgi:hypothetical protein
MPDVPREAVDLITTEEAEESHGWTRMNTDEDNR